MTVTGLTVCTIIALALGLLFTPLVRGIAVRWNLCDKPNGRTMRDIAHIGGAAIIGAILFALIPAFLHYLPPDPLHQVFTPILIASGFLVFLLGIIDDLRSLHYIYKLCFQIAVSVLVAAAGIALLEHFGIAHVPAPLLVPLFLGIAVWMLAVTTSFNLIDGLDGLAAGLALIAAVSFAVAGHLSGQPLVAVIALVTAGAAVGFLPYNFPPATIFMGDSGSLFLGLLFGLLSLVSAVPPGDRLERFAGGVIVLAIPLIDTALAFARRLLTNRPVFAADHRHIHHLLLYRFRSVKKADAVLWSLGAAFGFLGVLAMRGGVAALAAAAILGAAIFAIGLRAMIRFGIPESREEEILGSCGITTSHIAARE